MTLSEEIEYVIHNIVKDKKIKIDEQDVISSFKDYIGIGKEVMTMESICKQHNLQITKGSLSNYFTSFSENQIDNVDTPIINQIYHYLDELTVCNLEEFLTQLNNITSENISYKGYQLLFKYIKRESTVAIVDMNFTEADEFNNKEGVFVIKKEYLKDFLKQAKEFRSSITKHGLTLEKEIKEFSMNSMYLDSILKLYRFNKKYVEITDLHQKKWIMLENNDNVVINTLRKIIPYAEKQSIEVLADILTRAARRTTKYTNAEFDVYQRYLQSSSYINIDEWKLNEYESKQNFTKYDLTILNYFAEDLNVKKCTFKDLKNYFYLNGKSKGCINKISWSTVVKQSGQRKNYIYEPVFSPEFISHYRISHTTDDIEYCDLESEKFEKFRQLKSIPEKVKKPIEYRGRAMYPRNREVAKNALVRAKHKCEYDIEHYIFMREDKVTGYTEPHHLIPLKYQDRFNYSLDREQNIVSLCSSCHNLIHYGADKDKLISDLYKKRKNELEQIGIKITLNELLDFYN